jgi:hypothetical protein
MHPPTIVTPVIQLGQPPLSLLMAIDSAKVSAISEGNPCGYHDELDRFGARQSRPHIY